MGRLMPSPTGIVLKEKESWSEFRKALRKDDREIFDELFSYAKFHATAIGESNKFYPMEAILLSMLIEMKKEINNLKSQLKNGT
ncbi:hypothetical protein [Sulfurihydrogenibium subterraneum]|uniref:hypothetical protein n=1 Tax=Sulfurihydrogenibium subterraneum TaxID=171121 RepID=UPI0004920E43|nr:hypothetical protein [Sulfurihydrogenibium subterraneum]